jgi:hypothetical protein
LRVVSDSRKGLTPAQLVAHLNAAGVETYVTESGSLMVRYWQVAVDDFVAPGHGAELNEHVPADVSAINWVGAHLDELRAHHGGQWVAVKDGAVVGSAPSVGALVQQLPVGIEKPFITFVPAGASTWNFVFGG